MKIGMYSDNEILEHLTEGEGRGFLGRSMYDAIKETFENKNKEIDRLNNIINELGKELKLKTDFIEELLTIIAAARDYELHDKCYIRAKLYEDKLKKLKEGNK